MRLMIFSFIRFLSLLILIDLKIDYLYNLRDFKLIISRFCTVFKFIIFVTSTNRNLGYIPFRIYLFFIYFRTVCIGYSLKSMYNLNIMSYTFYLRRRLVRGTYISTFR